MNSDVAGESLPPKWRLLLRELRAPFLPASFVSVVLGLAVAYYHTGQLDWLLAILSAAGVVLLHAGANVANDYFDHIGGSDVVNRDYVRPFTGGSRLIQSGLLTPRDVIRLSAACFAAGGLIGAYLAFRLGYVVLLLGLAGGILGYFYSAGPLRLASRGLGEVAVAVAFGILPVLGTYYVQTRDWSLDALYASLPVACLIASVLLVNEIPDQTADRAAGKRTWAVALGPRGASRLYVLLLALSGALLLAGATLGELPAPTLLGFVPAAAAIPAAAVVLRHHERPQRLAPAMGLTIFIHAGGTLLLGGGFVIARFAGTN